MVCLLKKLLIGIKILNYQKNKENYMNPDLIKDIFTYHPPKPEQIAIYEQINKMFLNIAQQLTLILPEGPGKTTAIRKLAECRMQANATVALEGKF